MIEDKFEFLCERRLKEIDPDLHACYQSSVFAMDRLLTNYKNIFPFYTNHTFEHSAQVIRFCNIIAGPENVEKMNGDEIYILLMGASLHDVGMGISKGDYYEFKDNVPGFAKFELENPVMKIDEYAREFHQEFSAEFIKKYSKLFEIPTKQHEYCICQVARGHRHMNLTDPAEYPDYKLDNGNVVRLSYLAALVKLADELDIAADRNLLYDYSQTDSIIVGESRLCYKCHEAIKRLVIDSAALILEFQTRDEIVYKEIMHIYDKVQKTFNEYLDVMKLRSDFDVIFQKINFKSVI